MAQQKSPEDIKRELRGPVNPIPTPFLADGQLDWQGFRNIIEIGITGGSPVSLLTYGDGQFDFLSDDEVAQLTRCLVEQTNGRALTVAARYLRLPLDSATDEEVENLKEPLDKLGLIVRP
jgi:hypothetical protein